MTCATSLGLRLNATHWPQGWPGGGRSLAEHARGIGEPLAAGELIVARQRLSHIVSRDTEHLDAQGVTRAAVESVLENGSDALLAPVFWFAVAGLPGNHRLRRLQLCV